MKTLTGCILLLLIGRIGCSDSDPLTAPQSLASVTTETVESEDTFVRDSVEVLLMDGRRALVPGFDKETAIAIFKEIIEHHTESRYAPYALTNLYSAYMMDPEMKSLNGGYSKEWRQNPDMIPYFEYLSEVIHNIPTLREHAEIRFYHALIRLNALIQAKMLGERLLREQHPESSSITYSLAHVESLMGNPDKAGEYYRELQTHYAGSTAAEMASVPGLTISTTNHDPIRWIPGIDEIIEGNY